TGRGVTIPILRRRPWTSATRRMSWPSSRIEPETVTCGWKSMVRLKQESSEVLPDWAGPMMPKISWRRMSKLIPWSTSRPPYARRKSSTSIVVGRSLTPSPSLAVPQTHARHDGRRVDHQHQAQQHDGSGIRNRVLDVRHLGGDGVQMHGERHALLGQAVREQVAALNRLVEHRPGEHDRRGLAGGPADLKDDPRQDAADGVGEHHAPDGLPAAGPDVPARHPERR